jgi:hypothetical protein
MRSATASANLGMRAGRVVAQQAIYTMRYEAFLPALDGRLADAPAVRMIVVVPSPSAVASTIRARQTCFCGLLRSSTIVCRRLRSGGLRWTVTPVRIPKTRTIQTQRESHKGLLCRHQSTRWGKPTRAELKPSCVLYPSAGNLGGNLGYATSSFGFCGRQNRARYQRTRRTLCNDLNW